MCAPQYLEMEVPTISRFNSQSTGNTTLIETEQWAPQPFSPASYGQPLSPIQPSSNVQYPGQWFYLDQVPPKLLKELRRQCDTSPVGRDQSAKTLSKGAARIRAWARPGKLGIDIKLRQKLNAEHDKVTQIRLEPEPRSFAPDDKPPLLAELPEATHIISELADASEPQELPSEPVQIPARMSSGDSVADPLPKYEPREEAHVEVAPAAERSHATPSHERGRMHRRSISQFSFVATPPRGLSLSRQDDETKGHSRDISADQTNDPTWKKTLKTIQTPIDSSNPSDFDRVSQQLEQEREIRQRYESLLEDVKDELSKQRGSRSESLRLLNGLRVARTAQYETETDIEPPSPSDEPKARAPRARKTVKPKVKRVNNRHAVNMDETVVSPTEAHALTRQAEDVPGHVAEKPMDHADARDGVATPRRTERINSKADKPDMKHEPSAVHMLEQADVEASPAEVQTVRRQKLPLITTTFHPASREPSPLETNVAYGSADPWQSHRPPHRASGMLAALIGPAFAALAESSVHGIQWLQRSYGPEPSLESGKVRVRWTCSCGHQLYDDFTEKRPGAARELEAYLNRPRAHTGGSPSTPSSAQSSRIRSPNSSFGLPPSSQTSWASNGISRHPSDQKAGPKPSQTFATLPPYQGYTFPPEPPWLLTCANEDRYTPKLAHLDMGPQKIRSDKDLAMSLRDHYYNVNKKWWRVLRLRGLTTIDFVQFEVHQNRFADIRKCPDVPFAGHSDYNFEPGDLLPPVGSHYLLHLFKHPEDYDGELITYLRSPKKTGRLQLGVGWGINLVEGFEAAKVWLLVSMFFAVGSLVFGVAWAWKRHDVQGAFGVAAWVCTLAGLVVGWLQASLG